MLVRNNHTKEYSIVFCGARDFDQKIQVIFDAIKDPKKNLEKIGSKINKWQRKYASNKQICNFYEYSQGGYLAIHVKENWKVFRITINS